MNICSCGRCGLELSEKSIKRGAKYIKGHNAIMNKNSISPMRGKKHTTESIMKMKASHKGQISPMLGKKSSLETKKKQSLARLGKTWEEIYGKEYSDVKRKKQSELFKNIIRTKIWSKRVSISKKGEIHSEEWCKKLRGQKRNENFKIKMKWIRSKQIFPLKDSNIEVKIQNYLKELEIEYLTHHYIKEIEHGYQCDILIPSLKMVIECDGDYWHKYPIGNDIDKIRTSELLEKGFKVLRLWEHEIKKMNVEDLKMKIEGD